MRIVLASVFLLMTLSPITVNALSANELGQDWPQWRGPSASGAAAESASPPLRWSENENIRWKVEVPGAGSSTPIVWKDRVYVSTAVKTDRVKADQETAAAAPQPEQDPREESRRGGTRFGSGAAPTYIHEFLILAYDRGTGKEVWRTKVTEEVPHEAGHETNSFASASPVTDGQRLYVSFGSRGVFCLDLDGNVLWDRDFGSMQTRNAFGEGSSPAVHEGTLVVPWDHEGDSFVVAMDAATGEEKWRVARDERSTWATPLITEYQGQTQVILNGQNRVRSYDLADGELIWECGGQAGNPIPSPVRYQDNVICMTGFRGYAIYSIPLSAQGDITGTNEVTWVQEDAAPYVPSPLLYHGQLYFVKANTGVLVSRSAETGDIVIDATRLPEISSVYASPVAAGGHVYLTGRDGTTIVLKHGSSFDPVATNKLDEEIDASAAIADNQIFLRGSQHLYCIAGD